MSFPLVVNRGNGLDSHFSVRKMVHDEQFPFQFGKWIEISDRQRFPIMVNMGNGPDC